MDESKLLRQVQCQLTRSASHLVNIRLVKLPEHTLGMPRDRHGTEPKSTFISVAKIADAAPYLFIPEAIVFKHVPSALYGKVHPSIAREYVAFECLYATIGYWQGLARAIVDVKANVICLLQ
jgi:hypothetical protein